MTSDEVLLRHKDRIIEHTTDGEEGFEAYLSSTHINIITDDLICCYSITETCIVLYYMEAFNKQGYRECRDLGIALFKTYTIELQMPIIYTGVTNLFSNNSVEIEPNIYQFFPKEFDIN